MKSESNHPHHTSGKRRPGAGQDPNISGRYDTPYASGGPEVQRMVILESLETSYP